jgi:hypothetical protein
MSVGQHTADSETRQVSRLPRESQKDRQAILSCLVYQATIMGKEEIQS